WSQAIKIGYALLLSPLIGFAFAAMLLLALRTFVKNRSLYKAPKGDTPPPWWIRGMLIATCWPPTVTSTWASATSTASSR
ncbi:hypothetical protein Q6253_31075, partial [Klebsiella quasipneumoniae]|nr:hypothetical protein [Klebsiella quasipneumoniae]